MHGLAAPLQEEDEEIEVAGDERDLPPATQQQPARGGEDEVGEQVARRQVSSGARAAIRETSPGARGWRCATARPSRGSPGGRPTPCARTRACGECPC